MASNTELLQAFRAFDANGDNTISEAEFVAVLTRPVPGQPARFTVPQAKAHFKQVDLDGSGSVEYEEFVKAWASLKHGVETAAANAPVFVPLSTLRTLKVLPRRGRVADFRHPVTKQPNANLGRRYEQFNTNKTAYIFVSHRWLRPGNGARGHPDDEDNHKLRLIVSACEKLQGPNAPIPADFEIAVWLDFCCIDQDGAPASELEQLGALIQRCDLLLTPVHDPGHKQWEYPAMISNWYEEYKAEAWEVYWSRGWCRVEALLAAAKPVLHPERAELFRGALAAAIAKGGRPHTLYGTKEEDERRPPVFLPPLQHSYFERFKPTKGNLTNEADRMLIGSLEADAERSMPTLEVGYTGERNAQGQMHGRGTYKNADGDVYEGDFKNDDFNGRGTYRYADGDVYEGEWKDDKKHGRGTFKYASGSAYEGEYKDGKRHGRGTFKYANGGVYEGEFKDGKMHGRGTEKYASGAVYEGEWKDGKMHGHGTHNLSNGDGYEGEYKDGKRHGLGTHKRADGSVFHDGDWKDDKPVRG